MKINEKIVIDTNILIYFFNADSEFHSFARSIITDNRDNIFITHKSITEFVCVLSKIGMNEIIDRELPKIISNFNILFPDNSSLLIFNKLVFEHKPGGNKAYDYDIASIMLANNINRIVTINGDDFKKIKEISVISNK